MASNFYFRLVSGAPKPDIQFDHTFIPSSGEKDALAGTNGTPGSGNKFVTDSDARNSNARTPTSHGNEAHSSTFITSTGVTYDNLNTNGDVGQVTGTVAAGDDNRFLSADQKDAIDNAAGSPDADNPFTTVAYVQGYISGVDRIASCQYGINYVKTDTGAPSGSATNGEYALNTFDDKLYLRSGGSWVEQMGPVTVGTRMIFKVDGTDTSGNSGTFTHNNLIYTKLVSGFVTYTPTKGSITYVEDESQDYQFDGTDWISAGVVTSHNSLSGLQGGTASQYYHLTSAQHSGVTANSPSGSNDVLTNGEKDRVPVPVNFAYRGGFAASQTDVQVFEVSGALQQIVMPAAGSVVKSSIQLSASVSGGTLTAKPAKNGGAFAGTGLNLAITSGDYLYAETAVDTTGLTFSAGDKLGVLLTSNGAFAPTSADVQILLYVVFNT